MIKKIFIKLYIYYLRKKGMKIGESNRMTYPLPRFSKPYWSIEVGSGNLFSGKVTIITHDGASWTLRNLDEKYKKNSTIKKVKIGNNVFVGYDVTILSGVIIEDNVIIGAKSLITKNCEKNSVYAGNPARKICSLEEYRIKFEKKYWRENL